MQENSLAAKSPPAPRAGTVFDVLWESQPQVAGQMLAAAAGDTTYRDNGGVPDSETNILHNMINIGVGYGMKYIEIYQKDVTSLPAEITYARDRSSAQPARRRLVRRQKRPSACAARPKPQPQTWRAELPRRRSETSFLRGAPSNARICGAHPSKECIQIRAMRSTSSRRSSTVSVFR